MARLVRDDQARRQHEAERARRAEERERLREARAAQTQQQRDAIYRYATGFGQCPVCRSGNVIRTWRATSDSSGQSIACCLGCFLFPPLLLLLPFLSRREPVARCQYCGHIWPI